MRYVLSLAVSFLTIGAVVATAGQQTAQQRPPIQETVTIITDRDVPPMTSTPDEEVQRLREVDAIAVVQVLSLKDEKTPATKVRGIVTDGVKSSDRAALWNADGTIEFEFGAGEPSTRKYTDYDGYPLLKAGERYLIFFDLHPFMTRWYPTIPFRVDEAGRLEQVEWVSGHSSGWKSPINGLPLSEAVKRLRKQ